MKKRKLLVSLFACSLLLGGASILASCGEGGEGGGGGQVQPENEYTVTFNLNYSGAPAATTQKVKEGQKATKPVDPSRSGFTFVNWFENAAGTGSAFDFNTAITADKTLYAKWEEQGSVVPGTQYTVTFNLNYEGAPAATTQQVAEGEKATKPANPSRNGFTFVNWFENAAGTGSAFDFNTAIRADKTLYAKRTEQSTPEPGAPLPDNHQGTDAEDASWKRVDMYARDAVYNAEAGTGVGLAPYVTVVAGSAGDLTAPTNRPDSHGYLPLGNTNKNTGTEITYSLTCSADAKVGVYIQFSVANNPGKFNALYEVYGNGTKLTVEDFDMPDATNTGLSKWVSSEKYMFIGYANLTNGDNTVKFKIIQTSDMNNGANFYGFRFSAQSATIAGKAATPSA